MEAHDEEKHTKRMELISAQERLSAAGDAIWAQTVGIVSDDSFESPVRKEIHRTEETEFEGLFSNMRTEMVRQKELREQEVEIKKM